MKDFNFYPNQNNSDFYKNYSTQDFGDVKISRQESSYSQNFENQNKPNKSQFENKNQNNSTNAFPNFGNLSNLLPLMLNFNKSANPGDLFKILSKNNPNLNGVANILNLMPKQFEGKKEIEIENNKTYNFIPISEYYKN